MLKQLTDKELKHDMKEMIEECDEFIKPRITFLLTKETRKGRKNIVGVCDVFTEERYVVIDERQEIKIFRYDEIQFSKRNIEYYGPRVECCILDMLDKGFKLTYMDIDVHARIWDFIDEFIDEVNEMEKGLYDYLSFCEETGINYQTLVFQSNSIIITDALYFFYQVRFRNYGVLLYQKVDNQYLLLGTNFDERGERYYEVLLLDSKHEIVESKRYVELNNALSDFNKRFYHFKIAEHAKVEAMIEFVINEHIHFLEDEGKKSNE